MCALASILPPVSQNLKYLLFVPLPKKVCEFLVCANYQQQTWKVNSREGHWMSVVYQTVFNVFSVFLLTKKRNLRGHLFCSHFVNEKIEAASS